ncbi:Glyoxylase, beta-lactamase superfamily II [Tistlia consotensis]|uniref:Glyoxylase, beta-lactamase superfamily II n=1 Tax=Tistlia consotensis USBA 355 TaxID=560819 RepID=A0A1Y6CJ69_9PROT|nr:N-acyl homoserine lactonase family protein [Tistlia consotensis]SMF65573.1 Glyoxylase, beta-lactamase superfamily II [Tistlia consotensis USBA 355]SNS03555.1 Glyoxylase, beta-lactamase superfamily II [Tistlia consotensis]
MSAETATEVLAIKYAETAVAAREHFMLPLGSGGNPHAAPNADPHEGPHPISYFLWLIRHPQGLILVDTGFGEAAAARRRRTLLRHPVEALKAVGVAPEEIGTVVLTHLHYDHAGTLACFPNATFVVQARELTYAAGPAMRHQVCRKAFDVEDVTEVVRTLYAGRLYPVEGDRLLAPGVSLHLIGGHTNGLQVVRVETAAGRLVIASDATHFYESAAEKNPFPDHCSLPEYLNGLDRLFELTDDPNLVVPGHDERVLELFPTRPGDPNVVELHRGPLGPTPFAGVVLPPVREP